ELRLRLVEPREPADLQDGVVRKGDRHDLVELVLLGGEGGLGGVLVLGGFLLDRVGGFGVAPFGGRGGRGFGAAGLWIRGFRLNGFRGRRRGIRFALGNVERGNDALGFGGLGRIGGASGQGREGDREGEEMAGGDGFLGVGVSVILSGAKNPASNGESRPALANGDRIPFADVGRASRSG
ncbi:MAG: hypothetical protein ACAI43_14095, partial [Phycisphaerae bacterium]